LPKQKSSDILLNVENLIAEVVLNVKQRGGTKSFAALYAKHGAKRFAKENAGTLLQFQARQLTS
jgi:hypothetical protein